QAPFGIRGQTGILETAAASGLDLIAKPERDAVAASTFGTGELILATIAAGAQTVYLGVGGSATTDGGAGAIKAIRAGGGLAGARLVVLCDVRTPFEDAARVFGPQKGARPEQVRQLSRRLQALARRLPRDPRGVPMSGAAGGLAGGRRWMPSSSPAPRSCSTRSGSTPGCGGPARWSPARASLTARVWSARPCRRSRRERVRPGSRATRSWVPA